MFDFSQYDISKSPLGEGTYGKVFLLIPKNSNRQKMVIKVIKNIDDSFSVFEDEVNLLSKVTCENALILMDRGVLYPNDKMYNMISSLMNEGGNKPYYYIITPYFAGVDVQKLIDNDYIFSKAEIDKFVEQMFETLFCLHSNEIVHRDIKPGNIIYDKKNGFTLIDYGVSCYKECTIFSGTMIYMPLYIFFAEINNKKITFKMYEEADFFSLGVTLYVMVNKAHPFTKAVYPSKYPYGTTYIKSDSGYKDVDDLCEILCTRVHSEHDSKESIQEYYKKVFYNYFRR